MLPNQIPDAPVTMVMPHFYGALLVGNLVALALLMIWIFAEARRTNSLIPVLIVAGAMVATVTECLYDELGAVWYAQYGVPPLYRVFNISVPTWVIPGYAIVVGILGYWVYSQLAKGSLSLKKLWLFYLFAWAVDAILELPTVNLGVYRYYGAQPFDVFGFPLWQAVGNGVTPIMIAAVIYSWRDLFVGINGLLILLVVPVVMVMSLGAVGWPVWLALHSNLGYAATYPAAVLGLAIALLMVHFVGHKICAKEAARSVQQVPVRGADAAE